jgi:hypothetical protein
MFYWNNGRDIVSRVSTVTLFIDRGVWGIVNQVGNAHARRPNSDKIMQN